MLTRRHIRVKVLQAIYAYVEAREDKLEKQEKFLNYSISQMHDLYVLMLQSLVAMQQHADSYLQKSRQKHLPTERELNPSTNFVDNKVISVIASNSDLRQLLSNKKLNYWKDDDEYIALMFKELRSQSWYEEYLSENAPDFETDRAFVERVYREIIAPNDKLYEYLEDKRLTWLDDFPIVNTLLLKVLSKVKPSSSTNFLIPNLYKNSEDKQFALDLLRKVILNDELLGKEIDGKTPNWDKDRIADIDMIILKMGIAEFLYFPSIPVRATINEYLEISKEYSTPKSSLFINGILDKLVKDFQADERLNKIGRGLR